MRTTRNSSHIERNFKIKSHSQENNAKEIINELS